MKYKVYISWVFAFLCVKSFYLIFSRCIYVYDCILVFFAMIGVCGCFIYEFLFELSFIDVGGL